ncbi:MAG TPA: glycosyltransferase [Allosphingosinicella sp.]|nr:glycosyltransferase [Allosphingosinicella sp.]
MRSGREADASIGGAVPAVNGAGSGPAADPIHGPGAILTGARGIGPARPGQGRPRIALLLPNLTGGGAEAVNLTLIREFIARGHKVDLVLARATGALLDRIPPEVRLVDLSTPRLVRALPAIRRYLRRERPDAMLVGLWPLTVIAVAAKLLSGVRTRIVVCDHNILSMSPDAQGWLRRTLMTTALAFFYRRADARVAVSAAAARDLARLALLPKERFAIIHNPIPPPADAGPSARPAGFWPDAAGPRILTVGNLKAPKNHALLLRAFARLAEQRPAVLAILGEGPLRRALEQMVRELGVADRVSLPGFCDDPAPAYRSADLFVLSSSSEGFGNVLVEALAAGLPVVSTDCPGGPAEILDGGRYGDLVPCDDPDALADGMARALDAPRDTARLRARARDFVPSAAADSYLRLLLGSDSVR